MTQPHTVTLADGSQFGAPAGIPLLDAARQAGLLLPHSCRTGRCGSCRVQVAQGRTAPVAPDLSLDAHAHQQGWVLSCAAGAAGDLRLDVQAMDPALNLPVRTWPARIARIEAAASDVRRVWLRLPPNARFEYHAGQYLQLIGPQGQRRSYSMANPCTPGGPVELHLRRVPDGQLSRYWFDEAREGDLLRFEGPYGTACLRSDRTPPRRLLLLATGTGIAPVKAMVEALQQLPAAERPDQVHLLWGGRVAADLYWAPPEQPAWLRYTPVLSRPDPQWAGARGHVQDVLLALQPDVHGAVAHACGCPAMVDDARRQLLAAGVAPRDFHADAFVSA